MGIAKMVDVNIQWRYNNRNVENNPCLDCAENQCGTGDCMFENLLLCI